MEQIQQQRLLTICIMQANTNIIGYLQKKQFFQSRPQLSPSPNSRFQTHTPEKASLKEIHSRPSQNNLTILKNQPSKLNLQNSFRTNRQDPKVPKTEDKSFASRKTEGISEPISKRFDSSRVEIKMCLEDLSRRVTTELRLLQNSLAQLNASLERLFNQRLTALKQQLLESVQAIFAQAKSNIEHGLSQREQQHLKKVSETKVELSEAEKILKRLKVEMDSSWKKVAGEVLGEELDEKFENLLKQSQQVRKDVELIGKSGRQNEDNVGWAKMKEGIDQIIRSRLLQQNRSIQTLK